MKNEINIKKDYIIRNIICAVIGTSLAELFTFPLSTVKTNYQTSMGLSIVDTSKKIIKRDGIKGLYRAAFYGIASQVISTTMRYTLYQHLKEPCQNNFLAGGISGALSAIVTHPLDVIRTYKQLNRYIYKQFKNYRLKIFYRGYSKTFFKSSLSSLLFLPLFDFYNGYANNNFIAALCSGVTSTIIIQPLDYMKTLQISNIPYAQGYSIIPYFKGLSLNLSRVVPHFVITMVVIEWCRSYF